ncbi:DUF397 domain-containing protein [Streptomyces sp. NPDC052236]
MWRESTHSGNNGGDSVETADPDDLIGVRDRKAPDGGRGSRLR